MFKYTSGGSLPVSQLFEKLLLKHLRKKKKYEHERKFNGEPIPDDQPLLLSGGIMRDYQLKGYNWMATLYENGINGMFVRQRFSAIF